MSVKKLPDLSGLLVTAKGAAIPSSGVPQRGADSSANAALAKSTKELKEESTKSSKNEKPLNFKVSEAFYREFRQYAAGHDMKLNELLRLAFESYKTSNP